MQMLHFRGGCDSPCNDELFARGLAQRTNGVERQAGHQPFGIDVSVEKCAAEGIERLNHFQWRDCGDFAPPANRNLAALCVDAEDELALAKFRGELFSDSRIYFSVVN